MIQVYWKYATAAGIAASHGVTEDELGNAAPAVEAAYRTVTDQVAAGALGYATLPDRQDYRDQVMALADRYRDDTTDVVVLGIGGSALGNIALQTALNPSTHNHLAGRREQRVRLWVLDNVDPSLISETLKLLARRMKTTVFNVISKSGETAETAAQFMIVRKLLRDRVGADYARRVVATTDAEQGTLHDIAAGEGYATLPVPGDVGGRFSVLSPVGLFSAAMTGIDIDALLAGAAEMKDHIAHVTDWRRNPACVLAMVKYLMLTAKGKPMQVMMPYSNRLYGLADWYRQLWAESLGKRYDRDGNEVFVGPTPIKALGTTDQHSQIQLYREGPNDKLVVFLEVQDHPAEMRIADAFSEVEGLSYLRHAKLGKLITAEKRATEYALAESDRPSVTIRFDAITPRTVGQFIYLYEFVTSLMGELLNIDAYDQPAVELGKQATFALMGRPGYKEVHRKIARFKRIDKDYLA
ncbi:MAG: glucose-6-phosphate isomerase [Phycisphaerae bacterium]|nr:glucose-6-phosphate isomerase [Phycisphaerae bacterium]